MTSLLQDIDPREKDSGIQEQVSEQVYEGDPYFSISFEVMNLV